MVNSKYTKAEVKRMKNTVKEIAEKSLLETGAYNHDYRTVSTCNLCEWVARAFLSEFQPCYGNSWKDCAFILRQKWRDLFVGNNRKISAKRQQAIFEANKDNALFNAVVLALAICEEQEPCFGSDMNF